MNQEHGAKERSRHHGAQEPARIRRSGKAKKQAERAGKPIEPPPMLPDRQHRAVDHFLSGQRRLQDQIEKAATPANCQPFVAATSALAVDLSPGTSY